MVSIVQSPQDRAFERRRKVSRASRKIRDKRENSTRRALRTPLAEMRRRIMNRIRRIGRPTFDVAEVFSSAEWRELVNPTLIRQLNRSVWTGIQFEADFVGDLRPSQALRDLYHHDALRLPHLETQIEGPTEPPDASDVVSPPGIRVEPTPKLKRDIAAFLRRQADEVWRFGSRTTRDRIRRAIQRGLADGDTFTQMQRRIRAQLRRLSRNQAIRIARSETTGSMNAGAQMEREDIGIRRKQWISNVDTRVRGADPRDRFDHLTPDGQTVDNDKPFRVSGQLLMHPGDRSMGASAGNVVF